MTLTRTIEIGDITPAEMAEVFTRWFNTQQAEFFAAIRPIAATWPGAGWCQQSCSIVEKLNDDGRFVLETLAGHLPKSWPIAAAPDLLEALWAAHDRLEQLEVQENDVLRQVRAALDLVPESSK